MWTVTKLAIGQQAQKMELVKEKVAEERKVVELVAPAETNSCNYANVKLPPHAKCATITSEYL